MSCPSCGASIPSAPLVVGDLDIPVQADKERRRALASELREMGAWVAEKHHQQAIRHAYDYFRHLKVPVISPEFREELQFGVEQLRLALRATQ